MEIFGYYSNNENEDMHIWLAASHKEMWCWPAGLVAVAASVVKNLAITQNIREQRDMQVADCSIYMNKKPASWVSCGCSVCHGEVWHSDSFFSNIKIIQKIHIPVFSG